MLSTSVTAMRGSAFLRARAAVAPAKPPPITTTRGPAWASAGASKVGCGRGPHRQPETARRFKLTCHDPPPAHFCWPRTSRRWLALRVSVKPLAIRPMTVLGLLPAFEGLHLRHMSAALRPASLGTAVSTAALGAWQPGTGAGTRRRLGPPPAVPGSSSIAARTRTLMRHLLARRRLGDRAATGGAGCRSQAPIRPWRSCGSSAGRSACACPSP